MGKNDYNAQRKAALAAIRGVPEQDERRKKVDSVKVQATLDHAASVKCATTAVTSPVAIESAHRGNVLQVRKSVAHLQHLPKLGEATGTAESMAIIRADISNIVNHNKFGCKSWAERAKQHWSGLMWPPVLEALADYSYSVDVPYLVLGVVDMELMKSNASAQPRWFVRCSIVCNYQGCLLRRAKETRAAFEGGVYVEL